MGRARPAREWSENILSDIQFGSSMQPAATTMVAQDAAIITIPDIVQSAQHNGSEADSETDASKV